MLPTPGSSHRQHGGAKQVKTGMSATKSKYSDEKSLYIWRKYLRRNKYIGKQSPFWAYLWGIKQPYIGFN